MTIPARPGPAHLSAEDFRTRAPRSETKSGPQATYDTVLGQRTAPPAGSPRPARPAGDPGGNAARAPLRNRPVAVHPSTARDAAQTRAAAIVSEQLRLVCTLAAWTPAATAALAGHLREALGTRRPGGDGEAVAAGRAVLTLAEVAGHLAKAPDPQLAAALLMQAAGDAPPARQAAARAMREALVALPPGERKDPAGHLKALEMLALEATGLNATRCVALAPRCRSIVQELALLCAMPAWSAPESRHVGELLRQARADRAAAPASALSDDELAGLITLAPSRLAAAEAFLAPHLGAPEALCGAAQALRRAGVPLEDPETLAAVIGRLEARVPRDPNAWRAGLARLFLDLGDDGALRQAMAPRDATDKPEACLRQLPATAGAGVLADIVTRLAGFLDFTSLEPALSLLDRESPGREPPPPEALAPFIDRLLRVPVYDARRPLLAADEPQATPDVALLATRLMEFTLRQPGAQAAVQALLARFTAALPGLPPERARTIAERFAAALSSRQRDDLRATLKDPSPPVAEFDPGAALDALCDGLIGQAARAGQPALRAALEGLQTGMATGNLDSQDRGAVGQEDPKAFLDGRLPGDVLRRHDLRLLDALAALPPGAAPPFTHAAVLQSLATSVVQYWPAQTRLAYIEPTLARCEALLAHVREMGHRLPPHEVAAMVAAVGRAYADDASPQVSGERPAARLRALQDATAGLVDGAPALAKAFEQGWALARDAGAMAAMTPTALGRPPGGLDDEPAGEPAPGPQPGDALGEAWIRLAFGVKSKNLPGVEATFRNLAALPEPLASPALKAELAGALFAAVPADWGSVDLQDVHRLALDAFVSSQVTPAAGGPQGRDALHELHMLQDIHNLADERFAATRLQKGTQQLAPDEEGPEPALRAVAAFEAMRGQLLDTLTRHPALTPALAPLAGRLAKSAEALRTAMGQPGVAPTLPAYQRQAPVRTLTAGMAPAPAPTEDDLRTLEVGDLVAWMKQYRVTPGDAITRDLRAVARLAGRDPWVRSRLLVALDEAHRQLPDALLQDLACGLVHGTAEPPNLSGDGARDQALEAMAALAQRPLPTPVAQAVLRSLLPRLGPRPVSDRPYYDALTRLVAAQMRNAEPGRGRALLKPFQDVLARFKEPGERDTLRDLIRIALRRDARVNPNLRREAIEALAGKDGKSWPDAAPG